MGGSGQDSELHRMVGQIDGKLDLLIASFDRYVQSHNDRHLIIDQQVQQVQADINQAKGAKAALLLIAGGIAGAVAFIVDLVKGG